MHIGIVGSGNVATHLNRALSNKAAVSLINPRSLQNIDQHKFDLILLAVSDDAIKDVACRLPETDAVIAHTSGSVAISVLTEITEDAGVFYPLQTFSKNLQLNYKEIPVFLEASSLRAKDLLEKTAVLFTDDVRWADSKSRKQLHLASVFACNFTNALANISNGILKKSGIEFSALLPLMHQTIKKLEILPPQEAQTGPAVRGDKKIIAEHLDMLKDDTKAAMIYKLISEIIMDERGRSR